MENKGGVQSWCVACHSSPRGCGKLHILMLLKIWHKEGPSCPQESPPALLRGRGSPFRSAFNSVLADGVKSWAAPILRHASDSSSHQVGWRPGRGGAVLSICPSLPPRDMATQVRDAGFFSPTASLDRCALQLFV